MPPVLPDSDDNSDDGIPFRTGAAADANDVDDAGSDEVEEEYVVETITDHEYRKGELFFQVKWQGYDDPADMTWEPEENLETAEEVLKEYYAIIGGRPEAPSGSKRRGPKPKSKRTHSESNGSPDPATVKSRKKRANADDDDVVDVPRRQKDKYPPNDSSNWDNVVDACDTIEVGPINQAGIQEKFALLRWDNGQITKTTLRLAHKYAPQAMLRFYESHLRFGPVEPEAAAAE